MEYRRPSFEATNKKNVDRTFVFLVQSKTIIITKDREIRSNMCENVFVSNNIVQPTFLGR